MLSGFERQYKFADKTDLSHACLYKMKSGRRNLGEMNCKINTNDVQHERLEETLNSYSTISFGKRLKIALKFQGITQSELAEAIGVSQASISALIIRDSNSSLKAISIANYLGVSEKWLSSGEGDMFGVSNSESSYEAKDLILQEVIEKMKTFNKSEKNQVLAIAKLIQAKKELELLKSKNL